MGKEETYPAPGMFVVPPLRSRVSGQRYIGIVQLREVARAPSRANSPAFEQVATAVRRGNFGDGGARFELGRGHGREFNIGYAVGVEYGDVEAVALVDIAAHAEARGEVCFCWEGEDGGGKSQDDGGEMHLEEIWRFKQEL